jgi:hypothetical protein
MSLLASAFMALACEEPPLCSGCWNEPFDASTPACEAARVVRDNLELNPWLPKGTRAFTIEIETDRPLIELRAELSPFGTSERWVRELSSTALSDVEWHTEATGLADGVRYDLAFTAINAGCPRGASQDPISPRGLSFGVRAE